MGIAALYYNAIARVTSIDHVISEKSSLGIFAIMLVTLSTSMLVTSSATLSTSMTITPITTSNIISLSIINHQGLISKVYSRYLQSHQSSRISLVFVSDLVTHPGSIASHDAKNEYVQSCVTFSEQKGECLIFLSPFQNENNGRGVWGAVDNTDWGRGEWNYI